MHRRERRLLVVLDPGHERVDRGEDLVDEPAVPAVVRVELHEPIPVLRRLERLAVLVLVLDEHQAVVVRVHGDDLRLRAAGRLVVFAHVADGGGIRRDAADAGVQGGAFVGRQVR